MRQSKTASFAVLASAAHAAAVGNPEVPGRVAPFVTFRKAELPTFLLF